MGRSGHGSFHSGGGGDGYHSHSYSSSGSSRMSGGGGGGSGNGPDCCCVAMFCLVITGLVILCVLLIGDSGGATKLGDPAISPGEQMLVCKKKAFTIGYSSDDIKFYESVNGVPEMSEEVRTVSSRTYGYLVYNTYDYKSMLLTPGSVVTVNSTSDSTFLSHSIDVIKGAEEMEKFMNYKSYTSVYSHLGLENEYTIEATEYAEYFVVVSSKNSIGYTLVLNGTLPTFAVENLTVPEQCTAAGIGLGSCMLNSENNPEYCVVLDYNVSATYADVEITITGTGESSGLNVFIIMLIVVATVVFIVIIVVIVVIVVKATKKSGTATTTTTTTTSDTTTTLLSQQPSETSMESEAGKVYTSPSYISTSIESYNLPQPSAPLPTYSDIYENTNSNTQVFEPEYSSSYFTTPLQPSSSYN